MKELFSKREREETLAQFNRVIDQAMDSARSPLQAKPALELVPVRIPQPKAFLEPRSTFDL